MFEFSAAALLRLASEDRMWLPMWWDTSVVVVVCFGFGFPFCLFVFVCLLFCGGCGDILF